MMVCGLVRGTSRSGRVRKAEKGEGCLSEYNFASRDVGPFFFSLVSIHIVRLSFASLNWKFIGPPRTAGEVRSHSENHHGIPEAGTRTLRRARSTHFVIAPFASGFTTPTTVAAPSVPNLTFALAPSWNVLDIPSSHIGRANNSAVFLLHGRDSNLFVLHDDAEQAHNSPFADPPSPLIQCIDVRTRTENVNLRFICLPH